MVGIQANVFEIVMLTAGKGTFRQAYRIEHARLKRSEQTLGGGTRMVQLGGLWGRKNLKSSVEFKLNSS